MDKIAIWGIENNIHIKLYEKLINTYSKNFLASKRPFNKTNYKSKLYNYKVFHGITLSRSFKIFILAKLMGLKTINHWMGSDVLYALESWKAYFKVKITSLFVDCHLACSEPLVEELKSIGIKAKYVPVVNSIFPNETLPLPKQFSILAYLPDERHEFYGSKYIHRLAKDFPEVNFYIVAGKGGQYPIKKNVKYLGFQKDMKSIYMQVNLLIRMVDHDGFSLCVQEALFYGRHVIYSYDNQFCFKAENYSEVKKQVSYHKNNISVNEEGHMYMKKKFHPYKICRDLEKVYKNLIN